MIGDAPNQKTLEAMVRLIIIAGLVLEKFQKAGEFEAADNIRQDMQLLATYGAQQTAMSTEEQMNCAKLGIIAEHDWVKLLKN